MQEDKQQIHKVFLPLFSVHAAYGHLFLTYGAPFHEITAANRSKLG